jgi:hypothetical protein
MAKTESTQTLIYSGKEFLLGGLNVSDNPLIVSPAELTVANNVTIATSVARKKRPGQELYNTSGLSGTGSYPTVGSGNPIRGIIQYWRYEAATGNSVEDLFLHQGTKVWSIPNRIGAAVDRTGALTLTSTGIPTYQVFEGVLFFLSSTTADGYNKWDGTVAVPGDATTATAPVDGPGKYLGVYQGRMIMAGNPDFPFRVYISAALDAEMWTGVDSTSFDLDYDGDPEGITAIFPAQNGRMFVSTRRSIYEITGTTPADLAINPVSKGVGCVGQGSVVATSNDILFASDRGIHSLRRIQVSDQTEVQFLSKPIQTLWVSLLNSGLLRQIKAVWEETQNLYVITVPSSGQVLNDQVLCYNLNFEAWTLWQDISARSLSEVLISNKKYVLCGRENGQITFLNSALSTDLGVGYTMKFKTGKLFPGGDMTQQHMYKSITVLCSATQPSTIQVGWFIDSVENTKSGSRAFNIANTSAVLGSTFVMGTSQLGFGRFIPIRLTIDEVGYNMQLEITVSGTSNIEFYGYQLEVDNADPVFT